MRIIVLLLLLSNIAFGQSEVKTDCNTFFICIDPTSYDVIFSNSFVKDTLFICKETKTTTNNDNYTGKYAIGRAATIEFFKPQKSNKIGDQYGDWGIEFKTRGICQINDLVKKAEKSKTKIDTSSTVLNDENLKLVWYKSLSIKTDRHNLSILEYQKNYLNYLGFKDSEINTEMTYEEFNSHLANGKKYPRQFNKIRSITIDINKNDLKSLRQFCSLNKMRENKNEFNNGEFKIKYNLVKSIAKMPVREIEIDLIDFQPEKKLFLSEQIELECSGKCAKLRFVN